MPSIDIERRPERTAWFFHHPSAANYCEFWKEDDRLGQSTCAMLDMLARDCGARTEMASVTFRHGDAPRYAWAMELDPSWLPTGESGRWPGLESRLLPAQDFLKLHFPELPYFTQGTNDVVNEVAREWFRLHPDRQEDVAGPVYDHWSEENGYFGMGAVGCLMLPYGVRNNNG
ncbi:MAG: hypothetical protein FWG74_01010 [Planctomycetes bacterium]|nr:hypothetical protein [Planctomycetota bacterium]